MGYIDVAIPLLIGVLLIACPNLFFKKTGDEADLARKVARCRWIGLLLVGVAGLYFLIKLLER